VACLTPFRPLRKSRFRLELDMTVHAHQPGRSPLADKSATNGSPAQRQIVRLAHCTIRPPHTTPTWPDVERFVLVERDRMAGELLLFQIMSRTSTESRSRSSTSRSRRLVEQNQVRAASEALRSATRCCCARELVG